MPGSSTGATPSPGSSLEQQAASTRRSRPVPPGGEFVVVAPVFRDYRAWDANWTKLVWQKSTAYDARRSSSDPRVRLLQHVSTNEIALGQNYFKPLQAFVYRRVG